MFPWNIFSCLIFAKLPIVESGWLSELAFNWQHFVSMALAKKRHGAPCSRDHLIFKSTFTFTESINMARKRYDSPPLQTQPADIYQSHSNLHGKDITAPAVGCMTIWHLRLTQFSQSSKPLTSFISPTVLATIWHLSMTIYQCKAARDMHILHFGNRNYILAMLITICITTSLFKIRWFPSVQHLRRTLYICVFDI